MAKKKYKIENLESSFPKAEDLKNSMTVEGDVNSDIISTTYTGNILSYNVTPSKVTWDVSLTKTIMKITMIDQGVFRVKEKAVEQQEQIWYESTQGSFGTDTERTVIDENGMTKKRTDKFGYRHELITKLAEKKITVSDTLLNEVFGPMEKQIMEIYNKVRTFE